MFNIFNITINIFLYLTFKNYFLSSNNFKSSSMPCCLETIGRNSCEEMSRTKPYAFEEKCENDPDFAIIQCCQTCQTSVKVSTYYYFKLMTFLI